MRWKVSKGLLNKKDSFLGIPIIKSSAYKLNIWFPVLLDTWLPFVYPRNTWMTVPKDDRPESHCSQLVSNWVLWHLPCSCHKEKRKPTIEWLCPFWTGGNRCGLAVPGKDKAPHHCPCCRWSSVSRFPLQAWQAIGSRWSFRKHTIHVATQTKPQTCLSKILIQILYIFIKPQL